MMSFADFFGILQKCHTPHLHDNSCEKYGFDAKLPMGTKFT